MGQEEIRLPFALTVLTPIIVICAKSLFRLHCRDTRHSDRVERDEDNNLRPQGNPRHEISSTLKNTTKFR